PRATGVEGHRPLGAHRLGNQYVCISPDELVQRFRAEFDEPIEYLEKTLPELAVFEPASEVLTVVGLDAIRENSRYIVGDASTEVYISVWSEDLAHLSEALASAHTRGIRV